MHPSGLNSSEDGAEAASMHAKLQNVINQNNAQLIFMKRFKSQLMDKLNRQDRKEEVMHHCCLILLSHSAAVSLMLLLVHTVLLSHSAAVSLTLLFLSQSTVSLILLLFLILLFLTLLSLILLLLSLTLLSHTLLFLTHCCCLTHSHTTLSQYCYPGDGS